MGDIYDSVFGEPRKPAPKPQHTGERVFYRIHYKDPRCFDDGGFSHDVWWADEVREVYASDDYNARLIANSDEFNRIEDCASHPPERRRYAYKIECVRQCPERVSEVSRQHG